MNKLEQELREYIAGLRGKAARYYNYATRGDCDVNACCEYWGKNIAYDETADELEDMLNKRIPIQTEEDKVLGY